MAKTRGSNAGGSPSSAAQGAAEQPTVSQAEAAAAPGDQTFAGIKLEDLRRGVPQELHPYLADADGVQRLLGMGGMSAKQQKKILNAKDADGNPTGGEDVLAFFTDPDVLNKLASRISAATGNTGPQASSAVPGPSQAAQAAQQGGSAQAGPQPSAAVPGPSQAAQAAQQGAAGGKASKKAKEKKYPPPVGPNTDSTRDFVDAAGARFLKGRIGADQLQKMEMAQSPDGEVKMVYTFKDGSTVVTDKNGNNAVSVPPPSSQAGTTPAAPGGGSPAPQQQQPTPPSVLPNDPLVNFGRGVAKSIQKAPVAWGAGALTVGGIGTGIAYGLSGDKTPPPQDDNNDLFNSYQSIFPSAAPQPAASGTVPMQPMPATSGTMPMQQPAPQANPAGTAPALDTTLLNRLMKSREYA